MSPLRLATAALSRRIYAGRPTKDGLALKEPRHDVTSDALKAVIEHVGVGNAVTVNVDGVPAFELSVQPTNKRADDTIAQHERGAA